MFENWVGVDVGGANLKFAGNAACAIEPFALWQNPSQLSKTLQQQLQKFEPFDRLAVTMTGELADCYRNKQHGVSEIVNAVQEGFAAKAPLFYQTTGRFADATDANTNYLLTAASNWHAMAAVAGQWSPECILVDIGSTTTDIIPIASGVPIAKGQTDLTRLENCELLYTGVGRTNVAAVVNEISFNGKQVPIASEFFASIKDAYVVLGLHHEDDPLDDNNADGRPSTRPFAMHRLARVLCSDVGEIGEVALIDIAQQIAAEHKARIAKPISTVATTHNLSTAIIAGSGTWLAREILESIGSIQNVIRLEELITDQSFGSQLSVVGPAWAVKFLAERQQREFSGLSN